MTTIRAVAAYQVVAERFPRPVREEDVWGLAAGRAIDEALGRFAHESSLGRRPSISAAADAGVLRFEDGVQELGAAPEAVRSVEVRGQLERVLRAFRGSVIARLPRPRSRLLLLNRAYGVHCQPDFWDRRSAFYEMKSYRADAARPDLALQLRLFQLAFPGFAGHLITFDRFVDPVPVSVTRLAPPGPEEVRETLTIALGTAQRHGVDKVLEYVDAPVIPYDFEPSPDPAVSP